MKLLLDENLSRRIVLGLGNCSNHQVAEALLRLQAEIEAALAKSDTGFVEVV